MEIAQGAHAVLQVGLLEERAAASLGAPRALRVGETSGQRLAFRARFPAGEQGIETSQGRGGPGHGAAVQERDPEMQVGGIGRLHLRQGAHGMADLQPEVPERIKHRLGGGLPRGDLAHREKEQVDVAVRAQLLAAVTADREEGQARGVAPDPPMEAAKKEVDRP